MAHILEDSQGARLARRAMPGGRGVSRATLRRRVVEHSRLVTLGGEAITLKAWPHNRPKPLSVIEVELNSLHCNY